MGYIQYTKLYMVNMFPCYFTKGYSLKHVSSINNSNMKYSIEKLNYKYLNYIKILLYQIAYHKI